MLRERRRKCWSLFRYVILFDSRSFNIQPVSSINLCVYWSRQLPLQNGMYEQLGERAKIFPVSVKRRNEGQRTRKEEDGEGEGGVGGASEDGFQELENYLREHFSSKARFQFKVEACASVSGTLAEKYQRTIATARRTLKRGIAPTRQLFSRTSLTPLRLSIRLTPLRQSIRLTPLRLSIRLPIFHLFISMLVFNM